MRSGSTDLCLKLCPSVWVELGTVAGRGGESRDWLKTKGFDTARFTIVGSKSSVKGGSKHCTSPKSAMAGSIQPARYGSASPAAAYGASLTSGARDRRRAGSSPSRR